ncbi:MAG TPA: molybdenum cofactor guanylyltransferase [Bacteroidales bacterium]|nr:molybdenum cofactor guanylyltransferase [Bacteroidales bacterium]
MTEQKNLIIIGSSGRNAGKTEFACRLISDNQNRFPVYGVKIKRICTNKDECDNLCKNCLLGKLPIPGFEISEENDKTTGKDTSRMLLAGAKKVYFIKSEKDKLELAFLELMKIIPKNAIVVCESNYLRQYIKPGLFVLIRNNEDENLKESYVSTLKFADKIVNFKNSNWDFQPSRISFQDNEWTIKEPATAIILAGGKSSRMDGLDKSLLPINGIPLILHIVKQLEKHFDKIIIGSNDSQKFQFLNLPVIPDLEPCKGPLMGILSCLTASETEINFITACDIPIVNTEIIHKMMCNVDEYDMVIPVSDKNMYEPLFAIYKKSTLPTITTLLDNDVRKITEILQYLKVKKFEFSPGLWYQNLNKKTDYLNFINNSSNMS